MGEGSESGEDVGGAERIGRGEICGQDVLHERRVHCKNSE